MTERTDEPPHDLVRALVRAAEQHADRGVTLFDGRGRNRERRTYRELLSTIRDGAARLAARGVAPGDRVMVCLPTSWEWMESWLGALWLGALPVAVAPAGAFGSSEAHVQKLEGILERLDARLLVAGEAVRQEAEGCGAGRVAGVATTPGELADLAADPVEARPPETPTEIAFLQLTSGSTGTARAVSIPHRAVIHNNLASAEAIGAPLGGPVSTWAERMTAWLPLHHDMGLVGCLFMSVLHGLDLALLQPTSFLARPRLWLEELARSGPTFAPAPNFGYQLCVERLTRGKLTDLDLSGFRAALVGAEMVRPETVAAFEALTAETGFAPRAFRPCYGLAEATLAVTFDTAGEGVRTLPRPATAGDGDAAGAVVCVGAPIRDTELAIVAPGGGRLPDGEVGEVRVRGPGVFKGYYGDPDATAESLQDGWLATGDLGFLDGGELYLTGRLKDLLIIRGHNLMPHELEWLAEEVTGGGGAERSGAFSVERGAQGEQAVLVVETGERDEEARKALARQIRLRIARTFSLPLADVAFVRRGRIPKTTSGKVRRRELKARYLAGELERL